MAGSYRHCVDKNGQLITDLSELRIMIDTIGDVYESIEEMYGMIWSLASLPATGMESDMTPAQKVEIARRTYRTGLKYAAKHAEAPGYGYDS